MFNFIYLIIYFILKIFADGRFIIPVAAWLAPFFIIRFLRGQKAYIGIPAGILVSLIAFCISWYEMIPLEPVFYLLLSFGFTVYFFIPYIVDRLIHNRFKGFLGTLILPLLFVILEYFSVLLNPYGTWGTIANTQFENKYLLQLVSVTGIWGITFMVYWFASVLNWIIDNKFEIKKIKPVAIYLAVFLAVFIYGSVRINIFHPKAETVKIVTMYNAEIENFVNSDIYKNKYKPMMRGLIKGIAANEEDVELIRSEWKKFSYSIFPESEKQAIAGAKIISWAEVSTYLLNDDVNDFLAACSAFSKKYNIYFQVGLWSVDVNKQEKPAANRIITFDPDGKLIEDYHKFINIPGWDAKVTEKGLVPPLCYKTGFGMISTLNCFEVAFPYYTRKLKGADIVLCPSKDWKAIDPYNTYQAGIRAVENGYSIVRQTALGLSASYDYQGNTLSKLDFFTNSKNDNVMVSYVPVKGTTTVYSIIGDLFAWLAFVGLIFIILWHLIFKKE